MDHDIDLLIQGVGGDQSDIGERQRGRSSVCGGAGETMCRKHSLRKLQEELKKRIELKSGH